MRNTAKEYKNYGLSVLPTKEDKAPGTKKWSGVEVPLSDFEGAYGIGIKCGEESGNLECFDFDNKFGDAKQIISEYLKIEEVREVYEKHKLPIESTTSGGYHLLFRCQKNEGNLKLAQRPKYDEKRTRWIPETIIETRGQGGYFCADPTPGYKIIRNNILEINEISEEERDILFTAARSFNQWSEPKKVEQEEKERPGDYFNHQPEAIEEMKSCLIKHGWKNIKGHIWQRPDKSKGISATLGKVAPEVFYNFSSNGYPFEDKAAYTPFQVITLLDYNGDFKAFAQELASRYQLSTPDTYQKKQEKPKPKEKPYTPNELDNLLKQSKIDHSVSVPKPPVILEINHGDRLAQDWQRMLTLGNISCYTGKSKSKKTFLIKKILACLGANSIEIDYKFKANLPQNKKLILDFDTEESDYDSWVASYRIHRVAGYYLNDVISFNLRENKPSERLKIIEYAIEKYKDSIAFVMIDGIADLVNTINDETVANEILYSFMKWTKKYNIHIGCVLHQNKKDNYATGWLGTQIMKKSELIMSVEKDEHNADYSDVKCDMIRGAKEFPEFSFCINQDGLPEIFNLKEI